MSVVMLLHGESVLDAGAATPTQPTFIGSGGEASPSTVHCADPHLCGSLTINSQGTDLTAPAERTGRGGKLLVLCDLTFRRTYANQGGQDIRPLAHKFGAGQRWESARCRSNNTTLVTQG